MARHILIVDDQAEVREVIGMMLEELGYRVSMAAGAADMRHFLSTNEAVDLVIPDRRMPGKTAPVGAMRGPWTCLP